METPGVEAGGQRYFSPATGLAEKPDSWDSVGRQHDLEPVSLADLVGESQHYAALCLAHGTDSPPPPPSVSTIKLRQAGVCEVMDTQETFNDWLAYLIDRKVLPSPQKEG